MMSKRCAQMSQFRQSVCGISEILDSMLEFIILQNESDSAPELKSAISIGQVCF